MIYVAVPWDDEYIDSSHCKDVPAMDPDHQDCIGGYIYDSYYQPNCPNDKVRSQPDIR